MFLQQRACDRDALALAAREQRAAIADDGVEPELGICVRELRDASGSCRRLDLRVGGVEAEGDVAC